MIPCDRASRIRRAHLKIDDMGSMKRPKLAMLRGLLGVLLIFVTGCSKGEKSTTLQTSNSFQKRQHELPKPPDAKRTTE